MEREKLFRIVERRNLASFANNARWSTFFSKTVGYHATARVKHVAWPEVSTWSAWILPVPNYLEVLSMGPVHFREIEWIELDCSEIELDLPTCMAAVSESKLTSEIIGQVVRVFGYR